MKRHQLISHACAGDTHIYGYSRPVDVGLGNGGVGTYPAYPEYIHNNNNNNCDHRVCH